MDFNNLLDQKVGEVEAPKTFPQGTVTLEVKSRKFDKSKNKQTPYVEFEFETVGVDDDIDQEQLPDNWQGKKWDDQFYLTPDALKRLEEFLKMAGVEEGLSLRDGIEAVASGGHFVKAQVVHEMFTRKSGEPGVKAKLGMYASAS